MNKNKDEQILQRNLNAGKIKSQVSAYLKQNLIEKLIK